MCRLTQPRVLSELAADSFFALDLAAFGSQAADRDQTRGFSPGGIAPVCSPDYLATEQRLFVRSQLWE